MICIEQQKQHINFTVKSGKRIGIAKLEVDGYYYLSITGRNTGLYSAHTLRMIADALDSLNADWDREIDRYFENEKLTTP